MTYSDSRSARQRLASQDPGPIIRLEASPGCGKSTFVLLLLNALAQVDASNGVHRTHWLTAPTKRLVTSLLEQALKMMPLAMLAPLGQDCDGNERLWLHQKKLCENILKHTCDNLRQLADVATAACERAHSDDHELSAAHAALKNHFLANFHFNNSEERQQVFSYHESTCRTLMSWVLHIQNCLQKGNVN